MPAPSWRDCIAFINAEGDKKEQEEQEENNEKKKEENKKKRKKNRGKAGKISGRQMAVKKFDEENKGDRPPLVIPFILTVESMRKVLLEFSKGEEDEFSKDEASAVRIFSQGD